MTSPEARAALRKYIDYLNAPEPRMDAFRAAKVIHSRRSHIIQCKLNAVIEELWYQHDSGI